MSFKADFKKLTEHSPFPWQERLFKLFISGDFESCATCRLPTGVGKTSILCVWLLALIEAPDKVPRRLAYVVNRRTIVDQTTDEAMKLRSGIENNDEFRAKLLALCAIKKSPNGKPVCPLAISTLRGQFADNREWSADPTRPAIICGTVDMIGSRLLFDGYRCGFKTKPMQAGFLGTDTLLVHDEAHLEPAFQALLRTIETEQTSGQFPEWNQSRVLRAIELSATARNESKGGVFELAAKDYKNTVIHKRLTAKKTMTIHNVEKESQSAAKIAELALGYANSGQAILVYVNKVEDVKKIVDILTKAMEKARDKKLPLNVAQLTGTIRGYERDRLATENPVFQRFLPASLRRELTLDLPNDETVFLVANSAGSTGVNISGDHLVCSLDTTYEHVAQRLGRVNRFGDGDAKVDVVVANSVSNANQEELIGHHRAVFNTLKLLERLLESAGDCSNEALSKLPIDMVANSFSPLPEILHADELLFDKWAMTSFTMASQKNKLPGKPPVKDWLHGVEENEVPQTQVAWRDEVEWVTGDLLASQPKPLTLSDTLNAIPLLPHELLRDSTKRVYNALLSLSKHASENDADAAIPIWLINEQRVVEPHTLNKLVPPNTKAAEAKSIQEKLAYRTIILPESLGGLNSLGMFVGAKGDSERHDVAAINSAGQTIKIQPKHLHDAGSEQESLLKTMRCVLQIQKDNGTETPLIFKWYSLERGIEDDSFSWSASKQQLLSDHLDSAEKHAKTFASYLKLPQDIGAALAIAARYHDLGKNRELWQRGIGNDNYTANDESTILAKSGGYDRPINQFYRHEFGSLIDIKQKEDFLSLSSSMQFLAMHLVAAHHGRGRPHFPELETFDPSCDDDMAAEIAQSVPESFANLQRTFGRWQLAWLESLLRAADYLASQ